MYYLPIYSLLTRHRSSTMTCESLVRLNVSVTLTCLPPARLYRTKFLTAWTNFFRSARATRCKLDPCWSIRRQFLQDNRSRVFFIQQLRSLFEEASIEPSLREQVNAFLSSTNIFLDLLLSIRNLPSGDEYLEYVYTADNKTVELMDCLVIASWAPFG